MKREIYNDLDGQELIKTTWDDGDIWFFNKEGKWHRLDGPALLTTGYKSWCKNGKRHREDGPAYIDLDGTEEYYLEGEMVSKKEIDLIWLKRMVGK